MNNTSMEETQPRKKILFIDDDNFLRSLLASNFAHMGYRALEAESGEEGLRMALEEQPDLIICDVLMPDMGGVLILKNLREDERGKKLKVVVLSNLSDQHILAECQKYNIAAYLIKVDLSMEDIVKKVESILKFT